ncbi:MAG: hypothetical protein J2P38_00960, partial [Candidatus Dormibacteraeota bacterium]|nr:hypothetical protein [Candidatus Dormibacteraeota bacterium]
MINLILTLTFLASLVGVALFVVDAAIGAWERLTELPEVGSFAADSAGKVMLAIGAAALSAVLALLVAQHGLWPLAAAGGGIVSMLKVIAHTGRPPHSLKRRVAWR